MKVLKIENALFFWATKVNGIVIFIDYWKVLALNFSEIDNTVFFEPKSWWKDDIYWLLKSSCFELFRDRKYGLSFSQKVDGKMVFTWSFWAFHDIPGLGKYVFRTVLLLNFISVLYPGSFVPFKKVVYCGVSLKMYMPFDFQLRT